MQAKLAIYCEQCSLYIGKVKVDTADMPNELQEKINKVILAHRPECEFYGGSK